MLGTHYGESKFRKQKQYFDKMLNANRDKFVDSNEQLQDIRLAQRELERSKIQFRDERNAWQKQNYIDARVEQKLDLLEKQLTDLGKVNFSKHGDISVSSDNDMLVILSDLHIGQTFHSFFGEYNTGIAKDRLQQLLDNIISIQKLHNSERCYVSLHGDLISGSIHKTIQVTNRENVIEQIKIATEFISSFCYELTKHFKLSLQHINNFHILTRNVDSGIVDISIRGKTYVGVHGDFDPFSKVGVQNLCLAIGYIPYAVLYGHLHTCALDEVNGVKMIRGGSLAGCGDQHTVEKRLTGKPSQMVCICTDKGVQAFYPIELK